MAHARDKVWACRGEKRRGCGGGAKTEVQQGKQIAGAITALKKQIGHVARVVEKLEGPKKAHHKKHKKLPAKRKR